MKQGTGSERRLDRAAAQESKAGVRGGAKPASPHPSLHATESGAQRREGGLSARELIEMARAARRSAEAKTGTV